MLSILCNVEKEERTERRSFWGNSKSILLVSNSSGIPILSSVFFTIELMSSVE